MSRLSLASFVLVVVCAAAALLPACASVLDPLKVPEHPPRVDFEEEDGVVVLDRVEIVFKDEDGAVAYEQRDQQAMALHEKRRDLLELRLHYDKEFTEPIELRAETVRPDGKRRTWSEDEAIDAPSTGYALYSDNRAMGFDFSQLPLKTLAAVRTRTKTRQAESFRHAFGFGWSVPSLRSVFEVVVPNGWEIEHSATRLGEAVAFPPEITDEPGGGRRYTWARDELPPFKSERLGPPLYRGTLVHVRLSRWTEDGVERSGFVDERGPSQWLFARADERSRADDRLKRIVAEALKGVGDDPREKAKHLYAWTRDKINYCAIAVGWGGWIPHEATQTAELRYGDCKDKANLLRALLKIAGVDSRLVQLHTNDGMAFPYFMPTVIGNSNHQILEVRLPDGDELVDPTTQVVPFGRLPLVDQGTWALPQDPAGARLIRTPLSTADENVWSAEYDIALAPGQALEGTFALTLTGNEADKLRYALLATTSAGYDDAVKKWLPLRRAELSGVEIEGGAPPVDPAPAIVRGKVSAARVRPGEAVLLRVADLLSSLVPALPDEEREYPVVFSSLRRRHDVVRLRLPPNAVVPELPDAVELSSETFDYRLSYRREGEALVIDRRFDRKRREIPAAEYAALRGDFMRVLAAESLPLVVRVAAAGTGR